jgi:hypothetical protein
VYLLPPSIAAAAAGAAAAVLDALASGSTALPGLCLLLLCRRCCCLCPHFCTAVSSLLPLYLPHPSSPTARSRPLSSATAQPVSAAAYLTMTSQGFWGVTVPRICSTMRASR